MAKLEHMSESKSKMRGDAQIQMAVSADLEIQKQYEADIRAAIEEAELRYKEAIEEEMKLKVVSKEQ